jgi:hypothetical protein
MHFQGDTSAQRISFLVRFGFYKKNNQIEFFFKKLKPVQTNRFRFGSVF